MLLHRSSREDLEGWNHLHDCIRRTSDHWLQFWERCERGWRNAETRRYRAVVAFVDYALSLVGQLIPLTLARGTNLRGGTNLKNRGQITPAPDHSIWRNSYRQRTWPSLGVRSSRNEGNGPSPAQHRSALSSTVANLKISNSSLLRHLVPRWNPD